VIEHREERRDENNGGQHLEREDEPHVGIGLAEFSKDERGTNVGKIQEFLGGGAGGCKEPLAGRDTQDEETERKLQAKTPSDGFQLDGATIRREYVCSRENHGDAEHSDEPSPLVLLLSVAPLGDSEQY
jgi:hypothetical protein